MQNLPDKNQSQECECCRGGLTVVTPKMPARPAEWQCGRIATAIGSVPVATTSLTRRDRQGARKVRWGIGRFGYRVSPGLYAVGTPVAASPVFVTANYKMSFDRLRSSLAGLDGWILVLDTKGVNVWCAAGKGTFGTDELVERTRLTGLAQVVDHRQLILPQLGATGISAHQVKERCGFRVIYGPVRAADIPAFLSAGNKATPEMRRVRFPLGDRLVLIPIEVSSRWWKVLALAAAFFVLSGLGRDGFSAERLLSAGPINAGVFIALFLYGALATPVFLPWLPGRAFAVKGAWAALPPVLLLGLLTKSAGVFGGGWLPMIAWMCLAVVVSSYLGMLFTGSSTYTSLSGVEKEMKIAIPAQITAAVCGTGLWIAALFV